MAKTLKTNVNGTWHKVKQPWVNINGTWKKVKKAWVNVNGVWKESYSSEFIITLINSNDKDITAEINAAPNTDVHVVIPAGVVISQSKYDNSQAALSIGVTPSKNVTIINNGSILGKGGNGASARQYYHMGYVRKNEVAATAGGTALKVTSPITIINNGKIYGGGGGGGAGASRANTANNEYANGGGGGGGQGHDGGNEGSGGGGGTSKDRNRAITSSRAQQGHPKEPGKGGTADFSTNKTIYSGLGAIGGAYGQPGHAGYNGSSTNLGGNVASSNSAGASAGKYILGNSHVTWSKRGDVKGLVG